MAGMNRVKPTDMLLSALIAVVWIVDVYKLATGFHMMSSLARFSAGMCFFVSPAVLWQIYSKRAG
jgi:hypothetical protein